MAIGYIRFDNILRQQCSHSPCTWPRHFFYRRLHEKQERRLSIISDSGVEFSSWRAGRASNFAVGGLLNELFRATSHIVSASQGHNCRTS